MNALHIVPVVPTSDGQQGWWALPPTLVLGLPPRRGGRPVRHSLTYMDPTATYSQPGRSNYQKGPYAFALAQAVVITDQPDPRPPQVLLVPEGDQIQLLPIQPTYGPHAASGQLWKLTDLVWTVLPPGPADGDDARLVPTPAAEAAARG